MGIASGIEKKLILAPQATKGTCAAAGLETAQYLRRVTSCLLYTSDAADDLLCVDLGGRRIINKKKKKK